jgi:hypothetical protein
VAFYAGSADVISLQGYPADEVAVTSQTPTIPAVEGFDRVADYVKTGCQTFTLLNSAASNPYSQESDTLNALSMTICAYTGRSTITPFDLFVGFYLVAILANLPKESRNWEEVGNAIRREGVDKVPWFSSLTSDQLQKAVDDFLEEMSMPLLQGLRTATTNGGYFANLPSITEPGDEIWVIQGCRLPVVLRKSQNRPGMFRLVGSCYCHGIMDGEALQRPEFSFRPVHIH